MEDLEESALEGISHMMQTEISVAQLVLPFNHCIVFLLCVYMYIVISLPQSLTIFI